VVDSQSDTARETWPAAGRSSVIGRGIGIDREAVDLDRRGLTSLASLP
jgi:hypothetical protein